MVFSNQELLAKISELIEKKFSELIEKKLDNLIVEKFAEQNSNFDTQKLKEEIHSEVRNEFAELSNEISRLREQNERLLKSNNDLFAQNEQYRNSIEDIQSCDSGKEHFEVENDDADSSASDESEEVFVEDEREFFDCLILSDSIYRHVGKPCPKTDNMGPLIDTFKIGNVRVLKTIIPGACCDRLWAEAARLNNIYTFGLVILSVGTNYVPSTHAHFRQTYQQKPFEFPANIPPEKRRDFLMKSARNVIRWRQCITPVSQVISDITTLIRRLGTLFFCDVSFSIILPQKNLSCIRAIGHINSTIIDFCQNNGYGYILHPQFKMINGKLDLSLFATDGVHLRSRGIDVIFTNLRDHIEEDLAYENSYFA